MTNLPDFKPANILVIGDVMLDRYWHGSASRISPEAPVPVVNVNLTENCLGGAANVALNLAALDAKSTLLGTIGKDEAGDTIQKYLEKTSISSRLLALPEFTTITKLRILAQHQQLIRLDFEDDKIKSYNADLLLQWYIQVLSSVNLIIISDYGKNSFPSPIELIQHAIKLKIPVLVDPKGNDFSKYKQATLVKPNKKEFELIVGPCPNTECIIQKGTKLLNQYQWQALLITQGDQGMTLVQANAAPKHFPTFAQDVYDVTGAGDTVISTIGAALGAGCDLINAINLANTAASIVVAKIGTSIVHLNELAKAYHATNQRTGITTIEELTVTIKSYKQNNETIVMTNGCFDLLHSGHIEYLQEAKALGNYLIVAVNDDESVKKLNKGQGRPINKLSDRMSLLSALSCVDWVVSFSETTPINLISKIKPDILVKGGDYTIENIVGADIVKENGGFVKVLPFKPGYSSSELIEKIKELP